MDETRVICGDLNELLPAQNADPWHRMSALEHDCVLVVEFSELEGPKPALCVPESPGAHFDPNDFAVWLMTADYQMTNHRTTESNFGVNKDIQMMLVNEEQGVYTYAHHFTLFDIDARGFFRPFCASYVTVDERKLSTLFEPLRDEFLTSLERVKNCNRRQFLKELTEAVEALNTVETQAISSYYELYYDGAEVASADLSTKKPEVLNLRYRRLQRELENVHKLVGEYFNGSKNSRTSSPSCINHTVNMDPWVTTLRKGEGVETRKTLKDFKSLCPCAFDDFCTSMRLVWTKFRHWNEFCSLFLMESGMHGGRVCLDTVPFMYLPQAKENRDKFTSKSRTNDLFKSSTIGEVDAIFSASDEKPTADKKTSNDQKRLLSSFGSKFQHILYPLLIGQFTLVFGCVQRKETVTILVQKLKQFIPTSSTTALCYKWHEGRVPSSVFGEFKLFGLSVPKNQSVDDYIASNIKTFVAALDLNSDVLHAAEYKGVLLQTLSNRNLYALHNNDSTLSPFVFSVVSKIALFAYVLYFHIYGDGSPVTNGSQLIRLHNFASTFALSEKDMKMIKYLVELLKLQQRRMSTGEIEESSSNAFESMFFDYEPMRALKL